MPASASLQRLQSSLPKLDSPDIGDQARAVLNYLIEPICRNDLASIEPEDQDPLNCPNCGFPIDLTRSPYCSTECKETAGFVRQFRSGVLDGTLEDSDRQIAFGQNLWFLLGGGRPLRQSLIPEKTCQLLMDRCNHKCELCDAPAACIDHIATGCNRSINLRAVCEPCCRAKPFGSEQVLTKPQFAVVRNEMVSRIGSSPPLRCCDDAPTWDWREYLDRRLARMKELGL